MSSSSAAVRVGVIGAGLMGREVASAFGRWFALLDCPVRPELVAVCDTNPSALEWFRQVPSVRHFDAEHGALLARTDVDVVYVAVPHDRHEAIFEQGEKNFTATIFGLLEVGLGIAKRVAGKDKIRRRHGDRGDSGFLQRGGEEPSAKAFSKRREAIEKLGAGGRAAL